jgi:thiol-disulfide isomerase/thioredoxin
VNGRLSVLATDVRWIVMSPGIIALVSAVAVGVLLSVLKSRFDGRFRGTRAIRPSEKEAVQDSSTAAERNSSVAAERITAAELGAELGERATMLQFSSAFCAPCRATRRTLTEVESMVDGVQHIELDAESHLELVRRLDIMRTPTVLVLDATGAIVTRASGQPRKADVIAALGLAVDASTSKQL